MPAVSTVQGHVSRALDFYRTPNIYFSIGKTTEWSPDDDLPNVNALTSDENPPDPSPEGDVVDVRGYKKVDSIFLVYPDPSGELTYNGIKWKIVTNPDDAQTYGARWVYIASWLAYSELDTDIAYRQIGVFSNLIKKSTVAASKTAIVPDEVEDRGILQIIYNRTPVYRMSTQKEQLIAIIEF